jgi:ABC-type uncharacterized transport system ATPase subunit
LIAGENDTGKSTIGKVLFAIVQAFSKFPLVVQRENQVKLRFTAFESLLRKVIFHQIVLP